jgi:hypothetical protein
MAVLACFRRDHQFEQLIAVKQARSGFGAVGKPANDFQAFALGVGLAQRELVVD